MRIADFVLECCQQIRIFLPPLSSTGPGPSGAPLITEPWARSQIVQWERGDRLIK